MVHGQNLCDLVRLSYVRTVHISVPLGPKNLSLLFIGTHPPPTLLWGSNTDCYTVADSEHEPLLYLLRVTRNAGTAKIIAALETL